MCGRGSRSSLRILRPGLAITELAKWPLPGQPTAVWTLRRSQADELDALIVVSFANATLVRRRSPRRLCPSHSSCSISVAAAEGVKGRNLNYGSAWSHACAQDTCYRYAAAPTSICGVQVLAIGETVEEVNDSGFLGNVPTLTCQLMADDSMLQVPPSPSPLQVHATYCPFTSVQVSISLCAVSRTPLPGTLPPRNPQFSTCGVLRREGHPHPQLEGIPANGSRDDAIVCVVLSYHLCCIAFIAGASIIPLQTWMPCNAGV